LYVYGRVRGVILRARIADPLHFKADADPNFYFNADPYLDPAFHFNMVPDPVPLQSYWSLRPLVCMHTL
jgi:hypothetical protein